MKVSWKKLLLPVIALTTLVITSCPLPFDYKGPGAGNSQASDPSSPSVTAPIVVSYSVQGGSSGTIPDGGSFYSSQTTTVTLSTATENSVIFYLDSGASLSLNGLSTAKKINGSSGDITISRSTSSQSLDIHAIAIGPNMLPSGIAHATVGVSPYPVFSVTRNNASISEDAGTATFTITSSSASTSDITVRLQTSGDYEAADVTGLPASGASLTKTLTQSTTTISIPIVGQPDSDIVDDTVTLTILADSNTPPTYTVGAPASASVVIADNQIPPHTVTYSGNGSSSGTVPTDGNTYMPGTTVTVLGNSGNLARTGYAFGGWNTLAGGGGTNYVLGQTFNMGGADVTLYARWLPTYTVTYNGNGATGGSVPTDSARYTAGATVTVLGNSGSLVKTGLSFKGWNTQADGNGATYTSGQTLTMGGSNVLLYAKWGPKTATILSDFAWVGAGQRPEGMVFDGTSLWVGDVNDVKVYKINPSDGSAIASYALGAPGPTFALALDGAGKIWTTTYWTDPPVLYRFLANFTAYDLYLGLTAAMKYPTAMTFDPTSNSIWIVNTNFSPTSPYRFWKLNAANGSVIETWDLQGGTPLVYGLCMDSDPNYLWMASGNTLYRVSISGQQVVETYPIPSANLLQGVALVGTDTFWLVSANDKRLLKIQLQ